MLVGQVMVLVLLLLLLLLLFCLLSFFTIVVNIVTGNIHSHFAAVLKTLGIISSQFNELLALFMLLLMVLFQRMKIPRTRGFCRNEKPNR